MKLSGEDFDFTALAGKTFCILLSYFRIFGGFQMNERSIYLLSALAGGAILPIQVALNTLLKRYVSEPMQVTFILYLAGTLASFAICFFARYAIPT